MNVVHITHRADILVAQQTARRVARSVGFGRAACAELMIVASELASNVLKYGGRGLLRLEAISDTERGAGLRLLAEDEGPPFKSFETALLDGFDDEGLQPRERGKVVIATRYVATPGKRTITRQP
jgi:anti-sigma regulatory factor (Ser/Thr protein kinase)